MVALCDWLGLKADYVMTLVAYYAEKKPGCKVRYVEKAAIDLVNDGIDTIEALNDHIKRMEAYDTVAGKLRSMLGIGASLALAEFFAKVMHVDGSTMPYAQALIYSGGVPLNLSDVFTGSVILASSGAVMDLAMDIASGIEELRRHNPALPRRELFFSAVRIGRSVVGTMTTTLLLAYSGGYLTLLMVFAAQGTPPEVFLNSTLVSAEVVKTLVGSFGLVLVAPFTALIGAWIFGAIGEVRNHLTKEG
jgi:uncharacterized membrane protein